ncbi:hypothetical protein NM688_g6508 [Phlebia brevispora]|uniref:Uncharacterized protein n=1 Tax=Phlebia brevispora TaxID=194682 RepID=A0ACC1SFC4_9APHY|nr:hypothetical protein NM688_g6508 [Phlebia brevispora]
MIPVSAMESLPESAHNQAPIHPCRSPSLNIDVLRYAMSHVERREDFLSFMLASSHLYHVGIPILLAFPYIVTSGSLPSFVKLLDSKGPMGYFALRDLEFSFEFDKSLKRPQAKSIADVLRKATSLHALGLIGTVLVSDGENARATSSLTRLRRLQLDTWSADGVESILTQLHSPLRRVEVRLVLDKPDILSNLTHFCDTLEHATISSGTLLSSPVCYRNLTSLETYCNGFRLAVFAPAMPKLQRLRMYTMDFMFGSKDVELAALRNENLRFQANLSSFVWRLTYICLTLESSYVLGFDFHIPCINIRYTPQVQRMDWWDLFQTLIAPLRPFQLVYHEVAEPTSPATLSRIIREGNQNLQHDKVIDSLSPLAALPSGPTALSFKFKACPVNDPDHIDNAEAELEEVDTRAFARRVVRAVPSIQVVNLEVDAVSLLEEHWMSDCSGDVVEDPARCHSVMKRLEDTYGIRLSDCETVVTHQTGYSQVATLSPSKTISSSVLAISPGFLDYSRVFEDSAHYLTVVKNVEVTHRADSDCNLPQSLG